MVITNGTHCVYVHINKVNGKIYVGKTIHGNHPITRWRSDGSGYKGCSYFWKAIQKYGWSNFEHEVVANHLTKEEASKFEKLLINKLNTMDSRYGYNLTSGGENGSTLSEETKQKISQKMKGRFVGEKNPNYGNHKLVGENSPRYGRKLSEETVRKMKINIPLRYIWCFELNQLFHGAREATAITHVDNSDIGRVCRGVKKFAGSHPITGAKLHWCYVEKDMLKDADSINRLIEQLIVKWQEVIENLILTNKEIVTGVHFNKRDKKWIARLTYNGKRHHIGCFSTKEEAFQAYLDAERDLYSNLIKPKTREDFSCLFKELTILSDDCVSDRKELSYES